MTGKDYYKILEVAPDAADMAIKQSYRRLALKYHPDKNNGNELFEQKFKEINEAYRILSDSRKRADYNYTFLKKPTAPPKKNPEPDTFRNLYFRAKKLSTKVAAADPARMNKNALFTQVETLLSKQNMRLIKETGDEKLSAAFVECIFSICHDLPYVNIIKIIQPLVIIAGTNNGLLVKIRKFDKEIKYRSLWNDYKIIAALFVAFLFCLLIYFID